MLELSRSHLTLRWSVESCMPRTDASPPSQTWNAQGESDCFVLSLVIASEQGFNFDV